jgi:hypothetical protein
VKELENVRDGVKTRKKSSNELNKVVSVLKGAEQRFAYETWEARTTLTECRKDEHGYRVKANQLERSEWSRSRINGLEKELRTYESDSPTYDLHLSQKKREERQIQVKSRKNPHERPSREKGESWGFWKVYEEGDAEALTEWKKGILYKKQMTKPSMTSWDRVTYRKEWYDQRRSVHLRRRWVREGMNPWRCPSEMIRQIPHRARGVQGRSNRRVDWKYTKRETVNQLSTRGRTYERFANPEERRGSQPVVQEEPESGFQSRRRGQTARSGVRSRHQGSVHSRKREGQTVPIWTTQLRWLEWLKRESERVEESVPRGKKGERKERSRIRVGRSGNFYVEKGRKTSKTIKSRNKKERKKERGRCRSG